MVGTRKPWVSHKYNRRKVQLKQYAFYGMQRPVKRGFGNRARIYVFLYAPKDVQYCWVLTEREIAEVYTIKPKAHNIHFSVRPNAKDKGAGYRCEPEELLNTIKRRIATTKQ